MLELAMSAAVNPSLGLVEHEIGELDPAELAVACLGPAELEIGEVAVAGLRVRRART